MTSHPILLCHGFSIKIAIIVCVSDRLICRRPPYPVVLRYSIASHAVSSLDIQRCSAIFLHSFYFHLAVILFLLLAA